MKRIINLLGVCALIFASSWSFSQTSGSAQQVKTNMLVVYYSVTGNTEKMANAVVEGALKIPGVDAVARSVDRVTENDLKTADAIILGSPTYYGNMAAILPRLAADVLK